MLPPRRAHARRRHALLLGACVLALALALCAARRGRRRLQAAARASTARASARLLTNKTHAEAAAAHDAVDANVPARARAEGGGGAVVDESGGCSSQSVCCGE